VSLHLHKWIDLVFGYLQRGHPAREANNVFYYLTYEGAVDLDEISDPVLKLSTRDQIAHFGQTPSQLLKSEPHVARFPLTTDLTNHYRSIFVRPDLLDIYRINLDPIAPTNAAQQSEPLGAIVYLSCAMMNDRVIAVDEHGLIRIYRLIRPLTWQHVESNHPFKYLPNYRQRLDHATDGDQSLTLDTTRHGQHLTTRHSTHQFAISPDGRTLYSAAHWDGTAKVVAIDSHSLTSTTVGGGGQTALSLSPIGLVHSKPPLTCLALGEDGGLLVTGCADTTLTVWTVHGPGTNPNPPPNALSPPRASTKSALLPISLHPRHVLYGHDREITAVAISRDLDVCLSGSRDGTCLVHTLKQGQYVRALQLPHANASIDMIVICATTGHFVLYSKTSLTLYLYTINGKLLAQTDANDHLNHIVATKDGEYLISGGRKGTVVIRTLFTLQTVHKFQVDAAVCSLALSAEEKHLLVGLDNGKMILFHPRNL
jgi:WD40 repeat protein